MYATDNIAFAAYLVHIGKSFKGVSKKKSRLWWRFALEDSEVDELYSEWLSSKESAFFSKYLNLKSDMKSAKRSRR